MYMYYVVYWCTQLVLSPLKLPGKDTDAPSIQQYRFTTTKVWCSQMLMVNGIMSFTNLSKSCVIKSILWEEKHTLD